MRIYYSTFILFFLAQFYRAHAQVQTVISSSGVVIQISGSNNKVELTVNKSKPVYIVRTDRSTIFITVNTKARISENGKTLGTAMAEKPLVLNLIKGEHRLNVQSLNYKLMEADVTLMINKDDVNGQKYMDVRFPCYRDFMPIEQTVGGLWGYYNVRTGEFPIPKRFQQSQYFSTDDSLAAVKKDDKWGYINSEGKTVIQSMFDEASGFVKGRAVVKVKDKFGLINKAGEFLIQPAYESLKIGSDYVYVEKNADDHTSDVHRGIIGFDGKVLVDVKYDFITELSFRKRIVSKRVYNIIEDSNHEKHREVHWRQGVVDEAGKEILPLEFDNIQFFLPVEQENWCFLCLKDNQYYLYSFQGKVIKKYETEFDRITPAKFDFFKVVKQGKHGLVNSLMKPVVPVEYDDIRETPFIEIFGVGKGKKFAFFNRKGEQLTEFKYDNWEKYNYGNIIAEIDGKYGLLDETGKEISEFTNQNIGFQEFSEIAGMELYSKYYVVRQNGKYGFMDFNGHIVLAPSFDNLSGFTYSKGVSLGRKKDKYFIITPSDLQVIELKGKFENVEIIGNSFIKCMVGNKYVYFDYSGKCVINCTALIR